MKLKCDIVVSTSAFSFNLRRYAAGVELQGLGGAAQVDPMLTLG